LNSNKSRSIRSFVARAGRLTDGQRKAIDRLWPRIGVTQDGPLLDLDDLFGRHAQRILEIGFGNGESLAQMAFAEPASDFLGVEVHQPGIGHFLLLSEQMALDNVRVARADALDFLERRIARPAFHRVQIYFPDPWPKKRHHKRRLVRSDTIALLVSSLFSGGCLHLATDWQEYAESMLDLLEGCALLRNTAGPTCYAEQPAYRPLTKFEDRGRRLGHGVWELVFERR
jgi:tRNA (guanine-N7-)-methyltransferase